MDRYDYIITGSGAAGLSLLMHMIGAGLLGRQTVLLIDKSEKNKNDRTWCFWETTAGIFEPVVYRRWSRALFADKRGVLENDLAPYEYKLIRGSDFYNYCFERISDVPNVTVVRGTVTDIHSDAENTFAIVDGRKIFARYIFNSILFEDIQSTPRFLWQHFTGWVIRSERDAFDPETCTLMDFRVPQHDGNTTFVYVMPFSKKEALVEYTLFGRDLLTADKYEAALADYCANVLSLNDYEVLERETGKIPMTDFMFPRSKNRIINIGTAGGQTKPSSGYTFQFIQKHSAALVRSLARSGHPNVSADISKRRFRFYDRVLLDILCRHALPGDQIFSTLMRTNPMKQVFTFLDNETSLTEELRVIRKLPLNIFLNAALRSF